MCRSRRVFARLVAGASGVLLVLGAVVGAAALPATPAGASGTRSPVVKAVIRPASTGSGRTTRSDAASQVKPPSGGTYSVNLGYADTLRPNPANFPTPWQGDPHVVYEGCTPSHTCAFDGGAVEIVNTSTASETVGSVVITFAADCVYNIWPHNVTLPKGDELIVTELVGGGPGGCTVTTKQMDSSDIGPTGSNWAGNCNQSGVIPLLTVTVNGKTTQFRDSTQILNTKGVDANSCGHPNESEQWTPIGSTVCYGATLSLTPSTTKVKPGTTVTMTSKLLNSCGNPLAGVPVTLTVSKGPDSGTSDTVTTNASGVAKFVYKSSSTQGIDFLKATVTNLVGTISSPVSTIFNEKAALTVTPAAALPGATVKFSGTGFGANESVSVHGNAPTAPTLATVTANATGAISGTFVVPVPTSAGGGAMSEVVAVGATSGNQGWALFSSTCTDDWANPTNGNWATAKNWSTGAVPGTNDNACIILKGTYTVTLENNASVSSLTLGTTATTAPGTQTLNAQAAAAGGITLTTSGGTSISKHGVLALGSLDADNGVAVNGGPITNHGVFKTVAGAGGTRYLRSNLTNDAGATATFGANTNQDSGTTTTNNGTFTISTGAQLTVTNGSSVFDQAGGKFTNSGTFYMNGSTYDATGGSESGHAAIVQGSTFNDSAGAGSYLLQCGNTLKGTIPTGQTVTVQANGCGSATTYVTGAVTNAGTLRLDSTDADNSAYLQADTGASLTNTGTFDVLAGSGGGRYLRVSLANNGTVTIGANTNQDSGTTTTNNGTFTIAAGAQLTVTNGNSVFDQAAGTLTDSGTFYMNGSTFDAAGGAEAGNAAIVQGSTFNDSAGAGSYLLQCGNTLKGTIPTGQTVTVQANGCGSATTYVTGAVTNAGTLRLDSTDADNNAILQADTGASLTNTGTFDVLAGSGGGRYLRVSLANNGTVTIGADTNQDSGTTTTNNGTFTIAASAQLTVTNGNSVFDQAAGTLTDSGTFYMNGSTFDAAGGAEAGNAAIVQGSTFNDSAGAGSYLLQCGNTLKGGIPAGQTVTVQANGCGSATTYVTGAVTNAGTLRLDSTDADNNAILQADTGASLTNTGTFDVLAGSGGGRYLRVSLANNGTVTIGANTNQDSGTTTTNNGTFTIAAGAQLTVTNGNSVFDQAAGTLTDSGTFYMNGSTFDAAGGAEKGSAAILQSSTFNDSAGAGSYLLQCGNNLNGTVPKGQTVNVEANGCGSATVNLGGSGVTNNGTLELSSLDADNYSLMQGGPLTNHGTFETLAGNGGIEYIRVPVVNAANGKEVIDGTTTRQDSNTSTTNQGSFTLGAGVSYSMSGGSTFTESTAPTFGVTVTAATDSASRMTGGSASVTGTLSVTTMGTPTTGETFVPVTVSTFSGTFSTVQASPHTYHVAYGAHGFTLTAA